MFIWELSLNPPETFKDILLRMDMSEEEYFEYLKDDEENKIDAAFASLI